jgi:hypothetical protein
LCVFGAFGGEKSVYHPIQKRWAVAELRAQVPRR